jgi:hypothetical protein
MSSRQMLTQLELVIEIRSLNGQARIPAFVMLLLQAPSTVDPGSVRTYSFVARIFKLGRSGSGGNWECY